MRNSTQSMSNSLAPQHLPLRRSVTVDDARASKCICSGDALRTLTVGEEGTVTVALPFKSTAIRSHAWRAGSNYADRPVLTVRVMRARNKTSTVVFEEKTTAILEAGRAHLRVGPLEHSGPHILAITLNHAHVAGSPFVLSVEAAAASAEHSSFEGDECRAVAGERAVMILVCRDAMGNALTVGGAAVSASIELSTSDKILQADVTDHGDGTYAVATTISEAGTHRVVARVGGFQPEALPLVIVPGAPHGPSCRIATPKRWPVAGEPSTLELTACDAHGNEVEQGGTRWGGLLDAPAPPDGGDPWRRLEGALAVSDLGGGKYTIHIESATAGAHKLTIWPEWLFGGGEPSSLVVPVQVVPGATQPAGFLVEGRGLLHAAAGTPAAFVVRPRSFGEGIQGSRDQAAAALATLRCWVELPDGTTFACDTSARRRGDGDSAVDVELPPAASTAAAQAAEAARVAAASDPLQAAASRFSESELDRDEWLCVFTAHKASADARMHVEVDGRAVGGAPFRCDVAPGSAHAASCTVRCEHPVVLAGETLELYLQVRDRDGNARRGEEDDVAFEVRAVEETKAQLKEERRVRDAFGGGTQAVVALGSGVYALRIVREAAGEYYALPTVGGDAVPEVAFTVEPAAACGPRCDLSGAAATRKTCEVHVRMPLVVLVRDAFGNARLNHLDAAAENRVEALVDEGEGFAEPMVACGGGLHEGAIVGTRPGPLRVRVAVQGKTAKLITLAVHAGPSVARQCQVTNGNGWQVRVPTSAPLSFTVHACDAHGNTQTRGVDPFRVLLQPKRHGHHAVALSLEQRAPGVYACKYELAISGAYELSVTLGAAHIAGSPLKFFAGGDGEGQQWPGGPKPASARAPTVTKPRSPAVATTPSRPPPRPVLMDGPRALLQWTGPRGSPRKGAPPGTPGGRPASARVGGVATERHARTKRPASAAATPRWKI